jgi:thymidylate synthase
MSRIFMNCTEAIDEIRRDLAEMGHTIHPKSYQNKDISNDPDYAAKEVTNYTYSIVNPKMYDLPNISGEWVEAEAYERFCGERMNPGEAYKLRPEVWNQFLVEGEYGPKFDYSYPERFNPIKSYDPMVVLNQIDKVSQELSENPDSRQCYISIWKPNDLINMGGVERIPCTLGYLLQIRNGELQITYLQRSSDFATHFQNDVFLAIALAEEIATRINKMRGKRYPVGLFTHWIGSLHVYMKDIKNVF